MIKIVLASTNQGKVKEFTRLFNDPRIELVSMLDLVPPGFEVEETGTSFEENAWLKASLVCAATGLAAVADDSGLEVDALGGRPGVYSARYAGPGASDLANNELLLRELAEVEVDLRTGRFVCCLALAEPTPNGPRQVAATRGSIEGKILKQPKGEGGFGYDPLFEPRDFPGSTTAQLSGLEKDRISHRGQAARRLVAELSTWLNCQTPI